MKIKIISAICLLLVVLIYSCQSDETIEFKRYYSTGSIVYQDHCQNCHGSKGEGLAALIPPFTDTLFIKNNKAKLACMLQNGFKEKINVAGREFVGEMPAAGLSPIEIAQVTTYVTNSFGNKQGVITVEDITADLAKCN